MTERENRTFRRSLLVTCVTAATAGTAGTVLSCLPDIMSDPANIIAILPTGLLLGLMLWGLPGVLFGILIWLLSTKNEERLECQGYLRPIRRIAVDAVWGGSVAFGLHFLGLFLFADETGSMWTRSPLGLVSTGVSGAVSSALGRSGLGSLVAATFFGGLTGLLANYGAPFDRAFWSGAVPGLIGVACGYLVISRPRRNPPVDTSPSSGSRVPIPRKFQKLDFD